MDPLDFAGRAVVVTGGTRGIGAVIAATFHAAGANVLICGRTPPEDPSSGLAPGVPSACPAPEDPAADLGPGIPAADLGPGGAPSIQFFRADVRDPAQAAALIDAARERFGRLDVLINNAGGSPEVPAASASPRLHAKIIELNLIAPLHVAQAANAAMCEQDSGGVILMIGSVSGARPSPGTAAYGAAKAGLHHLATSLAAEWAPKVRVNSLIVGPVQTSTPGSPASGSPVAGSPVSGSPVSGSPASDIRAQATPVPVFPASPPAVESAAAGRSGGGSGRRAAASTVARTVPMGRAATAAEVASACLLLASPLAGYISGASLAVHGGGEWPAYLADVRDTAYRAQK
jgi:NAD(P)-dependent dehydrogenase (short-subunit alcohol dehydrogenase family)